MALSIAEAQARQTGITAAVYLRISKDEDDTRLGVDRQREDCLGECLRRGWSPVLFIDNDISASKGLRRPEYERMLTGVARGEFGAIIAHYADRLHRSPLELERFIDIVNAARVQVVTIKSGDYDLSTADGRMVARILGSVARGEVEKMAAKIAREKLQSAQRGEPNPGGRRPFGFKANKVDHEPSEAQAIRNAAKNIVNGVSLRTVAADLGMTHTRAKKMLTSERVAGLRRAGTEVVKATWNPILDRETWETVRSILTQPDRAPGGVAARRYLLSGFLRCYACGERLYGMPTQGRSRYRCKNNHLLRAVEPVDAYVTEQVLSVLESPAIVEALQAHDTADLDTKGLADEIAQLEARLARRKREYLVEEIITKADYLAAKAELEARIADARQALAARTGARLAGSLPVGSERVRKAWEAATLDERRQLIDVVVASITLNAVGRGSRKAPDETTVDIHWRVPIRWE